MTNRSWKVNNHGFDFRKRKHYFVISQIPDRLWGLYILLLNWDQTLFTVGITRLGPSWQLTSTNVMIKNVLPMLIVYTWHGV